MGVTTTGAVTCLHGPSSRSTSVAGVCNGGMGSLGTARFLNSVTRPIPVIDFKDAIEAICKPQFPHASYVKERNAALAISGGVDSMALAILFSEYQKTFP